MRFLYFLISEGACDILSDPIGHLTLTFAFETLTSSIANVNYIKKNYYAHLSKMFSIFANWHGNAFNQKHTKNVFLRVFKVCKLAKLECTRKVEGRNFSFPIHLCPFEIELFDFVNVKN